jgi:hypothetical protein
LAQLSGFPKVSNPYFLGEKFMNKYVLMLAAAGLIAAAPAYYAFQAQAEEAAPAATEEAATPADEAAVDAAAAEGEAAPAEAPAEEAAEEHTEGDGHAH